MKKLLTLLATLAVAVVIASPAVAQSADTGGGESPSAEEEQCWLPEGCEDPETPPDDQYPPDDPPDDQYPPDPPSGGGGGSGGGDSGGGSSGSGGSAAAASGGILPDTGGASLIALGAGSLLIGAGLLARRIVR